MIFLFTDAIFKLLFHGCKSFSRYTIHQPNIGSISVNYPAGLLANYLPTEVKQVLIVFENVAIIAPV